MGHAVKEDKMLSANCPRNSQNTYIHQTMHDKRVYCIREASL